MKAKLTDWYPYHIKPVRIGWYDCEACINEGYAHSRHWWDGEAWRRSPLAWPYGAPSFRWRGLKRASEGKS